MWCPGHGSYEWADPFTDVLPPTPKDIRRHVDSMKPSKEEIFMIFMGVFYLLFFSHSPSVNSLFSPQLEGALIRQQLYNCARNKSDTVQQATLRGEDIIWCHGHKAWDYSGQRRLGRHQKGKLELSTSNWKRRCRNEYGGVLDMQGQKSTDG